jgi:peptide/nickel transport system substrate-binding protein
VFYLSMNLKHPAFAKPEVREAMKYLVDYAGLGGTLVRHIGRMHQNFMPVGLLGASTEQPFKLDVDKAKALLAKAGYSNGFKATLDMRSVQPVLGIAESFQQTARRAGVEIEIIPGDGKQTLTKYRARKHDMFIGQWGTDYWDPHSNADTFARNPDNGDEAGAKTLAWRNSWDIPELSRKTDAAMLERDAKKRAAMYQEIQTEFRKASPFIMLYQQTDVAAHRATVEGLRLGPTADTSHLFTVRKR